MEKSITVFDFFCQKLVFLKKRLVDCVKLNTQKTIRKNSQPPGYKKIALLYFFLVAQFIIVSSVYFLSSNISSLVFHLFIDIVALPKHRFCFFIQWYRYFPFNVIFLRFIYSLLVVCCHMLRSMSLFSLRNVDLAIKLVYCFGLVAFYGVTMLTHKLRLDCILIFQHLLFTGSPVVVFLLLYVCVYRFDC